GWRKGDREVLVVAWLLPALGTAIATGTHLQLSPLALVALVWIAVRRVWTPRRALTEPAVRGDGVPS
ncbi:hypothetical protein, partial [Propionicimonas sp.]|uniref:hypothetical protein n=1 Tax=Propionicimonas sp. TaxID=1955623 RepID=UPI0039E6D9F5